MVQLVEACIYFGWTFAFLAFVFVGAHICAPRNIVSRLMVQRNLTTAKEWPPRLHMHDDEPPLRHNATRLYLSMDHELQLLSWVPHVDTRVSFEYMLVGWFVPDRFVLIVCMLKCTTENAHRKCLDVA